MVEESKYLKDIRYERINEPPVCTWEYIEDVNHNVRVYFKPEGEIGLGFIFYAIENIGHDCVPETENNEWHNDFTIVQCMYHGVAYFDGIRHLYMGDEFTDNYGYHYYPNIERNIATLKIINELEIKYCGD